MSWSCPLKLMCTLVKALDLPCYNLPPGPPSIGGTCLGASTWCYGNGVEKGKGYCQYGKFCCPSTRASLARRLELSKAPDFVERMSAELQLWSLSDYEAMRFQSSGDIYSLEYLKRITQIATNVPTMQFFLFTKLWRAGVSTEVLMHLADLQSLPNVHVWLSADPSTTDPAADAQWAELGLKHYAYVKGAPGDGPLNCQKQLRKGVTCRSCRKCFTADKSRVAKVTFKEHR